MALFTIETDYPNMLKLVNMCLIDNTGNCLCPSANELKHIFSPMLKADSYERELMASRLLEVLGGVKRGDDISAVADSAWKKRKEELRLNEKLYEESIKDRLDYVAIEQLLKDGANPTDIYDYELGFPAFSEIVNDRKSKTELPVLTKLFLQYGMNINSTINDCLHTLTWVRNEYGFETMKLIFAAGLDWQDAEGYISDMVGDMWQFEDFYPDDPKSIDSLFWAMREMMYLAALYADDIEKCKWTYKLIRPDLNNKIALKEFIAWDEFDYEYIDGGSADSFTSYSLSDKTIVIRSKATKEEVWRIAFLRD